MVNTHSHHPLQLTESPVKSGVSKQQKQNYTNFIRIKILNLKLKRKFSLAKSPVHKKYGQDFFIFGILLLR